MGGAPHDVSGTLNLDELVPGLYVTPDTTVTEGCIGVLQCHTLNLLNTTGADGTFALTDNGTYREITVWHPGYTSVTVRTDGRHRQPGLLHLR